MRDLNMAVKLNNSDAQYLTFRGWLPLIQGSFKETVKDVSKAKKLNPDNDKPCLYRAKVRIAENQLKQTCEDLHSAGNLNNMEAQEMIGVYCFAP